MFRDALARKRCLVPADGFFEWVKHGRERLPFYIHPPGEQLAAFAGLWARVQTDAGELRSFTIITVRANELIAPVHDRMPCVLPRAAWDAWLDPAASASAAKLLLAAPALADWHVDAVSTYVNSAAHDDPQCIAPRG